MTRGIVVQAEAQFTQGVESPAPVPPLAELAYRPEDGLPRSLEAKLIVLASAVAAVFSLITFVTSIWIYLQPTRFRTVGGFRALWSFEVGLTCAGAVAEMAVIAGVAAYLARRRVCLPLLACGSIGVLALQAVALVFYTFYYNNVTRSGADLVVWCLWRAGWSFNAALAPLLLLAVLWRPYVLRVVRSRTVN
jgi:hypothetical protein